MLEAKGHFVKVNRSSNASPIGPVQAPRSAPPQRGQAAPQSCERRKSRQQGFVSTAEAVTFRRKAVTFRRKAVIFALEWLLCFAVPGIVCVSPSRSLRRAER